MQGIDDRDDDDSLMLLRQGVDALDRVSDKLEIAGMKFERLWSMNKSGKARHDLTGMREKPDTEEQS